MCSSSEWDDIDPSEREDLHLQMEDGEFWYDVPLWGFYALKGF